MNPTNALPSVFDVNSLAAIKRDAKSSDPKALKAVAQQFEALFFQMVMKSMRDATPHEGMFDSEQTRMYEALRDQQLSQVMANKGGTGLAAMIEKQLLRGRDDPNLAAFDGLPLAPQPGKPYPLNGTSRPFSLPGSMDVPLRPFDRAPVSPSGAGAVSGTSAASATAEPPVPAAAKDFISRIWPSAVETSRATGIPAHFMVAQAALETGWGKSEPHYADGRPSYNLFGIKAGRSWSGAVAESVTTEYVDGVAQRQVERFRAYDSYADAFRDYASLLSSNPRYAGVIGTQDSAAFARGLQQSGFATDPLYAAKLERIIGGPTLRQGLLG